MFVNVETRVLDDVVATPQYDRATAFLNAIDSIGIDVGTKRIADLGTGFGSLALTAKRNGAEEVIALDAHPGRLAELRQRSYQAGLDIDIREANLLRPIQGVSDMDIAFLIGVVEYAGLWDLQTAVEELQRRVLENAYRVLKPGGILVFATKNRLWPPFHLKDIHTGLPLANALPRAIANRLSLAFRGTPYREYIHTPRGWLRIVQLAGFTNVTCYYPLFNYQFPLKVMEKPTLHDYQHAIRTYNVPSGMEQRAVGRFPGFKAATMSASIRAGIPISQSVIIRAVK